MPPAVLDTLLCVGAYLVGAVPFGYLVARARGVDLFKAGSGNIGATNVARTLGRKYGVLVFALDFLKGAGPVAAVVPLARAIDPDAATDAGAAAFLRVGAAALAFLGHLFPVFLGFRGGKGVATGAGAVCVLVPIPAAAAVAAWATVALATRYVSLASLCAAAALVIVWLAASPDPFGRGQLTITAFLIVGVAVVVVKHRANIRRLLAGTENQIGDGPMRDKLAKGIHILALGMWFGGAGFFNFVAAPAIFESFRTVAADGPSDRTAYQSIAPVTASEEEKKALASALAGAAVGPVFPKYFLMQSVCAGMALVTAFGWCAADGGRRIHKLRVAVLALATACVAVGWPLSNYVSQLRLERFHPDAATAAAAKEAFAAWHLLSLGLSCVTVLLAGVALAMAVQLPERREPK
ncbi:glycerol-3-phosphate 1-O-acyltransferase PlsY [Fimbriiglobus ruber]|nr:glycerol-3-phosphate 1-O-acyltransferase PlsY [Fimbriiglobus ruber]